MTKFSYTMKEGKRNMSTAFVSDATFYFLTVLMIVFEQQGGKKRPKTVHHI